MAQVDLPSVLAATLAPDRAVRDAAETELNAYLNVRGCCSMLLQLCASQPPAIAQASALCLKNHLRQAWATGELGEEDRLEIRGNLLPVLASIEQPLVVRPLVLCLAPMLSDAEAVSAFLDEITQFVQMSWAGGKPVQTGTAVRCFKVVFRSALADSSIARKVQPQLQSALGGLFQMLVLSTEARFHLIRKLICGTLRLAMHVCTLTPVFADLETLKSWMQAILNVLGESVEGNEQEQVLDWKSKARLIDTWQNLIAQSPLPVGLDETAPMEDARILELLFASYGAMFQYFLIILSRTEPVGDSDTDRAYSKCAISALHGLAQDACQRKTIVDTFIMPNAEKLLTETMFNFLRLTPFDVQLMAEDPSEYAHRNGEELRLALSCAHGLSPDECEECAEYSSSPAVTTPRSAAMMATREVLAYGHEGLVPAFFEFIKQVLMNSAPTPEAAAEPTNVANRVAAIRAFSCLADSLTTMALNNTHTEAQQFVTEVLIAQCQPQGAAPLLTHIQAATLHTLVRCMVFFSKFFEPVALLQPLQAIMQCLLDSDTAVRLHAFHAFRECLGHEVLEMHLWTLIPQVMNWLVEPFVQRHPHAEQALEALVWSLYRFPQCLGATNPSETAVGAELQAICQAHMTLCAEFIRRYEETKEAIAAAPGQVELEKQLVQFINCTHATVLSFPPVPFDGSVERQQFVDMLMPYITSLLNPDVLALAYRHATEAEVADVVAMVPRHNPAVVISLLPLLCNAVQLMPYQAELLVPQICEFVHGCGINVLVNADGSLSEFSGMIGVLFNELCKSPIANVTPSCLVTDLVRSVLLMSCCQGLPNRVMTPLMHAVRESQVWPATTVVISGFLGSVIQLVAQQAEFRSGGSPMFRMQFTIRLICAFSAAFAVDPVGSIRTMLSQGHLVYLPPILELWSEALEFVSTLRPNDFRLMELGLSGLLEVATVARIPMPLLQRIVIVGTKAFTRQQESIEYLDHLAQNGIDDPADIDEEPSVLEVELYPKLHDAIVDLEDARFLSAISHLAAASPDVGRAITSMECLGQEAARALSNLITRHQERQSRQRQQQIEQQQQLLQQQQAQFQEQQLQFQRQQQHQLPQ